jgi:hypothetical protein
VQQLRFLEADVKDGSPPFLADRLGIDVRAAAAVLVEPSSPELSSLSGQVELDL